MFFTNFAAWRSRNLFLYLVELCTGHGRVQRLWTRIRLFSVVEYVSTSCLQRCFHEKYVLHRLRYSCLSNSDIPSHESTSNTELLLSRLCRKKALMTSDKRYMHDEPGETS